MPKWTKIPDKYATVESDVAAVVKAANDSKDAGAIAAAKAANAKFINGYKKEFESKGKNDAAKKSADATVGKSLMELYNKAFDAATAAKAAAADAGSTKPKYTVDGSLPSPQGGLKKDDPSVKKATAVYNAMKSGKDPHAAATAAGISERPTIIEKDKGKTWAYEFRLSHGKTQHRLNAVATSSDKGKNIKVTFKFLGPGH